MRIVGSRFGKLRVLREVSPDIYLCRCECGKEVEVFRRVLTDKIQRDCLSSECHPVCHKSYVVTGHSRRLKSGRTIRSGEFWSWSSMKYRCLGAKPGTSQYENYRGRGITICERWLIKKPLGQGFANFLADMGPRPLGMTLDRIDVNGNYEPGNCKWSTDDEQCWNRRINLEPEEGVKDAPMNPDEALDAVSA